MSEEEDAWLPFGLLSDRVEKWLFPLGSRPRYYKLDANHAVVEAKDVIDWGLFFEKTDQRIVKQEQLGEYWVSTVFLGLDHSFGPGPPVLFETMVFVDKEPDEINDGFGSKRKSIDGQERYCTWDEALAGHEAVCTRLRENG